MNVRNRLGGLIRDAWWLAALAVAGCITLGVLVDPFLGFATIPIAAGTFVYFAVMRYGDDGREE